MIVPTNVCDGSRFDIDSRRHAERQPRDVRLLDGDANFDRIDLDDFRDQLARFDPLAFFRVLGDDVTGEGGLDRVLLKDVVQSVDLFLRRVGPLRPVRFAPREGQ